MPLDRSAALAKANARLKSSGATRLDPIAKAKAHPKSWKLAIAAKCWDCVGGGADGTAHTRALIRECPSTVCALKPWRPYQ